MAADDTLIPPTPSGADYAAAGDRPLIPDAEDPFALFAEWLAEATASEPSDANAMSLATVDGAGQPDVRVVLLKDVSDGGLTFYTNLDSDKGRQLSACPRAALGFHWKSLERQVRFRGPVSPVAPEAADAYFATRVRDSQIGAWASDQSRPLASREALKARAEILAALHAEEDAVPRPPYWGGFRLVPHQIEFWQSQAFRMHDRVQYVATEPGWTRRRLNP